MPKTITDIIPPSRRRVTAAVRAPSDFVESRDVAPFSPNSGLPPYIPPRRAFPWGTLIIAVIVVVACVGALFFFSGAKLELEPTTSGGVVSGSFVATPVSGDLPFALVTVQKTASKSVPAESTVAATDSAQGLITIYNTQAKAQPLVTGTRFETPAGLIFKIRQAVTVPASSGGAPGTLSATVYADAAGDAHNIGPSSFTLPGLKGSAQFAQVYARSSGSMEGGFSGTRPSVSTATSDSAQNELRATLVEQIDAAVAAEVPEGYLLVPGSITVTYAPLPDIADGKGGVSVRQQATATAVVFPKEAFARQIARSIVGETYGGQPVTLAGVGTLTLTPANSEPASASEQFEFTISGNAEVIWDIEPTKIAAAVAGKSEATVEPIVSGFPEIKSSRLTLRPFWRSSLPEDPSEIEIIVSKPRD